jgi:hypothetical protein
LDPVLVCIYCINSMTKPDTMSGNPTYAREFAEHFDCMQDTAIQRLFSPIWCVSSLYAALTLQGHSETLLVPF